MRISDCSSDVCSSELQAGLGAVDAGALEIADRAEQRLLAMEEANHFAQGRLVLRRRRLRPVAFGGIVLRFRVQRLPSNSVSVSSSATRQALPGFPRKPPDGFRDRDAGQAACNAAA